MNLFKKNKVNYTKEIEIVGGPYCYGIKNKRTGTMVSPKIFQEISDFYDGLAIIKQHPGGGVGGNWLGVIDDNGEIIISPSHDDILFIDYGNSLFVIHVCDRGGKDVFSDRYGKEISMYNVINEQLQFINNDKNSKSRFQNLCIVNGKRKLEFKFQWDTEGRLKNRTKTIDDEGQIIVDYFYTKQNNIEKINIKCQDGYAYRFLNETELSDDHNLNAILTLNLNYAYFWNAGVIKPRMHYHW